MLRQFNNISSWRKHDVTIKPHEVFTLNFRDTLPNIFVVNNPNLATLKIGISSIPREDSYEFKVEYNTTETLGRPIGTNNVYILNDSSVPVKIVIFSIEKEFDPALLKNMNVALDGYTIESSSEITGIRDGVLLPVELENEVSNSIKNMSTVLGGFDTNTYPEILTKLQALIDKKVTMDGSNMTLNGVQTDLTPVTNSLTTVITKLGLLDSLMKPTDLNGLLTTNAIMADKIADIYDETSKLLGFYKPKNKGVYLNNATSFEHSATDNQTIHFGWFLNDGEDCEITINGETVITIYAGEQLSDFEFELSLGDVIRVTSTSGNYRIKYWTY